MKENRKRRKFDFDDDDILEGDRYVFVVDIEIGVVLKGDDVFVVYDLDVWFESYFG